MRQPLAGPLRGERIEPHGIGAGGQLLVLGLLGRPLDHDHHRLRAGTLEIPEEFGPALGLSLPALDVAEQDDPPVSQHGKGVAQGVDLFRVELGGRALVEVEIAKSGVERPVQDGLDGLVLQDILRSVEVVDRCQVALLERPKQRLHGLSGHRGSVLPEGGYWLLVVGFTQ